MHEVKLQPHCLCSVILLDYDARFPELVRLMVWQSPFLVNFRVKGKTLHKQRSNKSCSSDARHNLPNSGDSGSENGLDLVFQGFRQRWDGRYDRESDLRPSRELSEELCRKFAAELVLEHCAADGDSPDLMTVPRQIDREDVRGTYTSKRATKSKEGQGVRILGNGKRREYRKVGGRHEHPNPDT